MGTAVFIQNGIIMYSGNQFEFILLKYKENPEVDVCVNITKNMHNILRKSMCNNLVLVFIDKFIYYYLFVILL